MSGIIAVPSADLGRYRIFDVCAARQGHEVRYCAGHNVAQNLNILVEEMLSDLKDWVWIIGDDHDFPPDTVNRLLKRNVPIVTALCLRKRPPYSHVVHHGRDGGWKPAPESIFDDKTGMVEISKSGFVVGNAGMLVRREVFERVKPPWFAVGKIHDDCGASDLYFCQKAIDAGYKVYVDLDCVMGHMATFSVWPRFQAGKLAYAIIDPGTEANQWGRCIV